MEAFVASRAVSVSLGVRAARAAVLGITAAISVSGCSTIGSTFDSLNPFGGESASESTPTVVATPKDKGLEDAAKAAQEAARPADAGQVAAVAPNAATTEAPLLGALPGSGAQRSGVGVPAERVQPVEVMWRVPTDPVEKYYILYGADEAALDKKVELQVKDIQKLDHPKFGPVFRYELRQVPIDKTLFISLQAENRFGVSAPTPPVKLDPGKRTVTP